MPSLVSDRILAGAAVIVAAVLVEYAWRHYPRPVEGGGLVLGMVAALASVRFLNKVRQRPIFGRVVLVISCVLFAQVVLQVGASQSWL